MRVSSLWLVTDQEQFVSFSRYSSESRHVIPVVDMISTHAAN